MTPTEYPAPLASIGHRLGGKALDFALSLVTLNIGWLIWSFVVWGNGQTPGKQILKMRVYDKTTRKPAKWGHMAIRELGLSTTLSLLILLSSYTPLLIDLLIYQKTNLGSGIPWSPTYFYLLLYFISIGLFSLFIADLLWIFRRGRRNRLTDVILKTDVLNESPDPK